MQNFRERNVQDTYEYSVNILRAIIGRKYKKSFKMSLLHKIAYF